MRKILCAVGSTLLCTAAFATPNQPPTARFTVNPGSGVVGTTFTVDASATTDDRTRIDKLVFRWHWDNTPAFQVAGRVATHQFATEGTRTILLEVVDQSGLIGTTTRGLMVQPTTTTVLVAEPEFPGAPEPDVDVDPLNPQRIVVSAHTVNAGDGMNPYPGFASTDGGATWSRATGIPNTHSADAQIEFDRRGNVFLAAIDGYNVEDGTPVGLLVTRSQDGGVTYSSSSYAMDTNTLFRFPDGSSRSPGPCPDIPRLLYDRPSLGVDRSAGSPYQDYLYIVAEAYRFDDPNGDGACEGIQTVFIRSVNHGATWDAGQAFGYHQGPLGIGIAPNGTVYLAGAPTDSSPCAGGRGVVMRKSVDGGASFLPVTCVLPSSPDSEPIGPLTVVNPSDSNRVFVAFTATAYALGIPPHIAMTRSTDAGATWIPSVRIDDVLADDAVFHLGVSASVSSTGRIDAAWFDYRNGPNKDNPPGGSPGDVYYSFSLDGGATWAPNLRLSNATAILVRGGMNDFLTVTSSGTKARVVYAQDTDADGQYETYLTTVNFH